MEMVEHLSSVSGNFGVGSRDLVRYDVPSGEFRFLRDLRL